MDKQQKPFGLAISIILLIIAGLSDVADLFTDLFFPVPVIGQVVFLINSFLISPVVWAIIQLSFIMKTGMGKASWMAVAGGLGNIANIPGSEIVTTAIAIFLANLPGSSQIAAVKAGAAGTKVAAETGGGRAENAAGGAAKEKVEAAERRRTAEAETAAPRGKSAPKGGGGTEAALGEQPTPFEELEKLTQETPKESNSYEEDTSDNSINLKKAA